MEGINILNQTEILTFSGLWIVALIGVLLAGVICISIGILCEWNWLDIIGVIWIIVFFIMTWVGPAEVPTGRYKYEVLIDETVSVTELYEKYEIVGQDGKIWIIEDKKLED